MISNTRRLHLQQLLRQVIHKKPPLSPPPHYLASSTFTFTYTYTNHPRTLHSNHRPVHLSIFPGSSYPKPKPNPKQSTNTATISFLGRFFFSFGISSTSSPAAMSAAKTKAQGIIDANPVAVFSKSYCPYCRATKSLLSEVGAKFEVVELDQIDDGAALQDALEEMTHQRTVPNVFINHKHIGGNSDLQAKKGGQLKGLLQEAGAL